jgi:NAD(P)H-hydrate epimerase
VKTSRNLYSAAQSRELDRIAIEEHGHAGLSLMKTAGNRAFANIARSFPGAGPVTVLCGSGNNGGDGYVVAECARSIGLDVTVVQASVPKSSECTAVCAEYLDNGGTVSDFVPGNAGNPGLIVDGLLGTGLDRAPSEKYVEIINWANHSGARIVALDIPSGLNSDTGFAFDPCIRAEMTVTFIGQKFGMFTAQGKNVCGKIQLETLNFGEEIFRQVEPVAKLIERPDWPARRADSHKGDYGNVVIAGGNEGMLGATLLAGSAALRCGSGLVTVLSTHGHMDMPALRFPELMSQCIENEEQFDHLCERCNVIVLGPGLGQGEWAGNLFKKMVRRPEPLVVDADGLNWLAIFPEKRVDWILTPHPGEAATLLGVSTAEVQHDRLAAAQQIVERFGGTCVLKGAGTLVADPAGKVRVCSHGNPGMASAGMGDVLSGVIGSLVGQGMPVAEAARSGTWLHSMAADICAKKSGMAAMLASDVVSSIPEVLVSG